MHVVTKCIALWVTTPSWVLVAICNGLDIQGIGKLLKRVCQTEQWKEIRAGRWFRLHALLLKRAGRWLQLHVILPAKPPTKTRTLNKSQMDRKEIDNAVWLTSKSIEQIEHAGLKPTPKPTDEPKKLKE